ncbi:tRNA lysidine(34) synthetase TilS [endosymbiont of Pachyrhynchus infernalis]|nr:tRNA(Ile)-lysidine synthase [endosymbiont of Pachyrhynchus infernalis]
MNESIIINNIKIIKLINNKIINLLNYIYNKYKIKSYVISFSGGIDSTVLLNIMKNIINKIDFKINIRAIHINHNLSIKSNDWEKHCIKECNKINIKLIVRKIKISSNYIKKYGIECSARKLRFNEINSILNKNEIVMIAHNKNDNLETLFLSLKRNFLGSIKFYNNVYGMKILRPLLNYSRKYIIIYAKYFNLNWIEDDTNNNLKIDRNFIRKIIISKLEERWPNFIESSSKAIKTLNKKNNIINYFINKNIDKNINSDLSLNINNLFKEDEFYIFNIIKNWIKKNNIKIPSFNIIKKISNEIKYKKLNYININIYNSIYIRKYKNNLFCIKDKYIINSYIKVWENLLNKFYLPYELGILIINNINKYDYLIKNNKYIIHNIRKNNENEVISIRINTLSKNTKIKFKNCKNNKCLKNIFQNNNIPFWNRNKIPMLFYNNKLICLIGIDVTEEGFPSNNNNISLIYKIGLNGFEPLTSPLSGVCSS